MSTNLNRVEKIDPRVESLIGKFSIDAKMLLEVLSLVNRSIPLYQIEQIIHWPKDKIMDSLNELVSSHVIEYNGSGYYWIKESSVLDFFRSRISGVTFSVCEDNALLNRELEHLRKIIAIPHLLKHKKDIHEKLNLLNTFVSETFTAQRCLITLKVQDKWLEVARNLEPSSDQNPLYKVLKDVASNTVMTSKGVCTSDIVDSNVFNNQDVLTLKLRSIVSSPLRVHGQTIGAICIDSNIKHRVYNQSTLSLLNTLCEQIDTLLESENNQSLATNSTVPQATGTGKLGEFKAMYEKEAVERALREGKGNKSKAARILGVTRKTLYRKLNRYNIV